MKKLKLAVFTFVAASLTLVSCSDDDNKTTASIEGRWTPTKTITIVNGNQTVTNYDGNETGCDKDYREFLAGGAYRYVIYYRNTTNDCTEDALVSTYNKSDSTLTIVDSDPDNTMVSPPDAGTYEITKLTGSELRLKSTANAGNVSLEVTYVYKKI